MSRYDEALQNLSEKLGNKDGLISLSTVALTPAPDGAPRPGARIVNAYYEDGAFYSVTHAASHKMQEIAQNPNVAVCVITQSFTADGIAENLGWVREEKNKAIHKKLREIFAEWYDLANNDESPATCILRVRMTKGLWFDGHKNIRKAIDFVHHTAD